MGSMKRISEEEKRRAEAILKDADIAVLVAAAVKIVSHFNVPLSEAMKLLNLSKATAWRHWNGLFSEGTGTTQVPQRHGGRRRQHLTLEEETEFLGGWRQKALEGQILTIAEMKDAFEARSGKPITDVGFYKLLCRHRWRKVKPDTKHPREDFAAQEESKKKTFSRGGSENPGRGKAKWAWLPEEENLWLRKNRPSGSSDDRRTTFQ